MSARVQRFDIVERRRDALPKVGPDPKALDEQAMLAGMTPDERTEYEALKKEQSDLEAELSAKTDAEAGVKALAALRANVEKLRANAEGDAQVDEADGEDDAQPERTDAREVRIDQASAHERMLARIGAASGRVDAGDHTSESQRDRIFARLSRGGR